VSSRDAVTHGGPRNGAAGECGVESGSRRCPPRTVSTRPAAGSLYRRTSPGEGSPSAAAAGRRAFVGRPAARTVRSSPGRRHGHGIASSRDVPVVAVERVPSSTEVPGMQIAIVGPSRTGANKVRRLLRGGYECSVFGVSPQAVEQLVGKGARGAGRGARGAGRGASVTLAPLAKRRVWPRAGLVPADLRRRSRGPGALHADGHPRARVAGRRADPRHPGTTPVPYRPGTWRPDAASGPPDLQGRSPMPGRAGVAEGREGVGGALS
jgi:hypothetical protein